MPIQAPHWTDYLNCPVCFREFGPSPRSPVSLGCGHTLCEHCLKHLHRKHCPFDQTVIQSEPEELAINTALLQLAGYTPPSQPVLPACIQSLPENDRQAYDIIVRCLEHLAVYLKLCANNSVGNRLSRPMQRKLVTLLQCAITDEEGRGRAARAARSLGERSVTELILQHQNPQQLSANLWAAVRARGCQFLGPAMQEEVLKLVLLALDDGSALSRKVLVMFVVQRLEGDFPQASKTSIGHVVQLLYRASCFKVSKRESDSSLMQLKEEFRTYESLRREHDAQIVQIATEAGLRIAPDQWSALLYGDTAHKSHMQSIIDKLQTPQSFAQSVQELFIALQRSGDPAQLVIMSMPLDKLTSIDPSPDATSPSWQALAEIIMAVKDVVSGLVSYLQQTGRDSNQNQKHNHDKLDINTNQAAPQSEIKSPNKIRMMNSWTNETPYRKNNEMPSSDMQNAVRPGHSFDSRYFARGANVVTPPGQFHAQNIGNANVTELQEMSPAIHPLRAPNVASNTQSTTYPLSGIPGYSPPLNTQLVPVTSGRYYAKFQGVVTICTDNYPNVYPGYTYQPHVSPGPIYKPTNGPTFPYSSNNNMGAPSTYNGPPGFSSIPSERNVDIICRPTAVYPYNRENEVLPPCSNQDMYNFSAMREALPPVSQRSPPVPPAQNTIFMAQPIVPRVGPPQAVEGSSDTDESKLEEGLMALEARIDMDYKIT